MENKQLKFKHKKTLQHLIVLLLSILTLIGSLIGYFFYPKTLFFFLIVIANAGILYVLFVSKTTKNTVVYDAVFVRYKLGDKPAERIKNDILLEAKKQGKDIFIKTQQNEHIAINLSSYAQESIDEFYLLLENICRINNTKTKQ